MESQSAKTRHSVTSIFCGRTGFLPACAGWTLRGGSELGTADLERRVDSAHAPMDGGILERWLPAALLSPQLELLSPRASPARVHAPVPLAKL